MRGAFATTVAGAMLLVVGMACGAANPPTPDAPRVEAADIASTLENGAVLLDVRRDAELAEHGTIAGFIHIPIEELEERIGELPRGVPILTA